MSWGDCGTDSYNRPIGYLFEGTCDELHCDEVIHRGLDYACGDMHGETEISCEGYFCYKHLFLHPCLAVFLCKSCSILTDEDEG